MLEFSLYDLARWPGEVERDIAEHLHQDDTEGAVLVKGADGSCLGVLVNQQEFENLLAIADLVSTKEGIDLITADKPPLGSNYLDLLELAGK